MQVAVHWPCGIDSRVPRSDCATLCINDPATTCGLSCVAINPADGGVFPLSPGAAPEAGLSVPATVECWCPQE